MRKNILKLDFHRLRKLEVQNLASSVIEIVENHNPETLHIKEIFDILVEQEPQIKLLKVKYGAHPITPDLDMLRTRRNAYAQGILNQLQTKERTKEPELEESIKLAKPILLRYLYQLPTNTERDIKQKLIQFFDFTADSSEMGLALDKLELTRQYDNLRGANYDIERNYNNRRKDISARPKEKTPDIVAALKMHILDLFKQIEVAQIKHKDLDYSPLIDELNNELAKMKAELKTRASYNKKKAEGALNKPEVVEKDNEVVVEIPSEEPSESTQSVQRMYPMNAEVDNEENLEELDIKKTVAVSTKQTRLPIVSPEA